MKNYYGVGENHEPGYALSLVHIIYLLLEGICLPFPGTLISSREDLGHLDDEENKLPCVHLETRLDTLRLQRVVISYLLHGELAMAFMMLSIRNWL